MADFSSVLSAIFALAASLVFAGLGLVVVFLVIACVCRALLWLLEKLLTW